MRSIYTDVLKTAYNVKFNVCFWEASAATSDIWDFYGFLQSFGRRNALLQAAMYPIKFTTYTTKWLEYNELVNQ